MKISSFQLENVLGTAARRLKNLRTNDCYFKVCELDKIYPR